MLVGELSARPTLLTWQRDDEWLAEHLAYVWQSFFADIPRANAVDIAFAKRWKTRLGLITLRESSSTTVIRLNGLLSHPVAPECLTTITVAHEMVHYSHGFGSTLPRRYHHPHDGNIVEKELLARGLGEIYDDYNEWIDSEWDSFHRDYAKAPRRLWFPQRSGLWHGLQGDGSAWGEAAASVRHTKLAAEGASSPER
ncbi:MAG: hypothetical protein ACYC4L_04945 [Chloroflexota bacterium]